MNTIPESWKKNLTELQLRLLQKATKDDLIEVIKRQYALLANKPGVSEQMLALQAESLSQKVSEIAVYPSMSALYAQLDAETGGNPPETKHAFYRLLDQVITAREGRPSKSSWVLLLPVLVLAWWAWGGQR